MISRKRKNAALYALTVLVVLLGIFLPGVLLRRQSTVGIGQVAPVPDEYYAAFNFAMARNASAKMSRNEKLQLVSGRWESTQSEALAYEMNLKEYEAAEAARKGVEALYQKGRYPVSLSSEYGKWYYWSASPRKAVDATFQTYTAYYWVVKFERYDRNEKHTICLLEDGTVYLAQGEFGEAYDQSALLAEEYTFCIADSQSAADGQFSDWAVYPELDAAGMDWKAYNQEPVNGMLQSYRPTGGEEYVMVQARSGTRYAVWFVPE